MHTRIFRSEKNGHMDLISFQASYTYTGFISLKYKRNIVSFWASPRAWRWSRRWRRSYGDRFNNIMSSRSVFKIDSATNTTGYELPCLKKEEGQLFCHQVVSRATSLNQKCRTSLLTYISLQFRMINTALWREEETVPKAETEKWSLEKTADFRSFGNLTIVQRWRQFTTL